MKAAFLRWQEALLCLFRKWWRPITQMAIAGTLVVNGIVIPVATWTVPSMAEMAAYVAAATAAFGVRAYEKSKGLT